VSIFRSILSMITGYKKNRSLPLQNETLLAEATEAIQDDQHAKVNESSTTYNGETMKVETENPQREENIPLELKFLTHLIRARLDAYFNPDLDVLLPELPDFESWNLPLGKFILENRSDIKEEGALLLLIALTPHIQPSLFDSVIESQLSHPNQSSVDFPAIGGVRGKNCRFFLPTGETALFLIAGNDLTRRLEVQKLFGAETIFWEKKILWLEDMQGIEPSMHGRLIMSPDYVDLLTYGTHTSPQFSISFPAKKIAPLKNESSENGESNQPSFDDLVIPDDLREQINEIKSWLTYNDELMEKFGMRHKLKKGYRTLFYGPPGTGKTFTAKILGNHLNKEVFKIDLSMVVSKYIGETEKNLELLFARAENKDWILFFDEADALFGKRTNVRDAHDKYANQEVSYLLQRIEDYNGLVILATNMKNNMDESFVRRFNSMLKFPFPDQSQRSQIWQKALPQNAQYVKRIVSDNGNIISDEPVNIPETVKRYELSGGNIINVVHYAGIKAVEALHERTKETQRLKSALVPMDQHANDDDVEQNNEPQLTIYLADILDGIKRELIKEGKPF
jgi:DNA polymerase III delta prime subunit